MNSSRESLHFLSSRKVHLHSTFLRVENISRQSVPSISDGIEAQLLDDAMWDGFDCSDGSDGSAPEVWEKRSGEILGGCLRHIKGTMTLVIDRSALKA